MYIPHMCAGVNLTVLTACSFACRALAVMPDHMMAGTHVSTLDPGGDDGFRNKPCNGPIYRIATSWSVRTLLATTVRASDFMT